MKQRDILIILVPMFILTVLWVMFTIYHNYTTSTIKDPLSIQIIPIKGTFDIKTLQQLKQRQNINPNYESVSTESVSPTPEVAAPTESEINPTEQPSPTPEGVEGL